MKMTGKAAINREARNHHLRGYGAFCCWTFPFPDLTFHPRRQIGIEMATIQTNKTKRMLMTATTNHVTSRPKIVPVSFAEIKKQTTQGFVKKINYLYYFNSYFDIRTHQSRRHSGQYHHRPSQWRCRILAGCIEILYKHALEEKNMTR